MDPFNTSNPLQPFDGHGVPGDPMEDVLSLQTYNAGGASYALATDTNTCTSTCTNTCTSTCTNTCTRACDEDQAASIGYFAGY